MEFKELIQHFNLGANTRKQSVSYARMFLSNELRKNGFTHRKIVEMFNRTNHTDSIAWVKKYHILKNDPVFQEKINPVKVAYFGGKCVILDSNAEYLALVNLENQKNEL